MPSARCRGKILVFRVAGGILYLLNDYCMMNGSDLLRALSGTLTKQKVNELVSLAAVEQLPVVDLLDLCFYTDNPTIAFRASWILEYTAVAYPDRFIPHLDRFIARLGEQQHDSCRRHFTKILMHLTSSRAPEPYKALFPGVPVAEDIAETMFEWLIEPRTPVAVKANCMDVLFNMRHKIDWVSDELYAQIEYELRNGSAALQSRGKRILNKLAIRSKS